MNGEGSTRRSPVVVLHERMGAWSRRLRPRLADVPARWFETRSAAELLAAASACTSPVALIEAGSDPAPALGDLALLAASASSPLILFVDPKGRPEVLGTARDLGATLASSGRVTPPEVASLVARWLGLAQRAIAHEGWTRPIPADPARQPAEWVEEVVAEAAAGAESWSPEAVSTTIARRSERDRDAPP